MQDHSTAYRIMILAAHAAIAAAEGMIDRAETSEAKLIGGLELAGAQEELRRAVAAEQEWHAGLVS